MVVERVELDLSGELIDEILAHAQAGYPEEVCGLVSGKAGRALAVYPGQNVSATPRVEYEMDVQTLARVIEFEDAGLDLLAIYHSHPHGPAEPSATDVERATYPDAIYLIVNLADRAAPALRAFRIRPAVSSLT